MELKKGKPFVWKNKPKEQVPHLCGYCKKPLEMKHPSQKYCDEWCRNYAYYQRKMERDHKVWEERICTECGKPFIPHSAKQLCCKGSCSGDRLRKWQRAWYHANKERLNLVEKYRLAARARRKKEKEERIKKGIEENRAEDLLPVNLGMLSRVVNKSHMTP